MEHRISATELARNLGDVLGRVRYRREAFVVERNGVAVARLAPLADQPSIPLREALAAWRAVAPPDPAWAADLEHVGAADRPPRNP